VPRWVIKICDLAKLSIPVVALHLDMSDPLRMEAMTMGDNQIRFDDGAAYERMMGVWSRLVGEDFVDWLAPAAGLRWIDVGCGNGAFTELLVERCAPSEIVGVDPSEGQLAFARARHRAGIAEFLQGDATALPVDDHSFDAAVMALVIFFVPDPAKGVAEMVRVVKPGGAISAYVWDLLEPGGFPMAALQEEMRSSGIQPLLPPSAEVSRMDALRSLWLDAGLTDVATSEITVSRTFEDFDDFWGSVEIAIGMTQATRDMSDSDKAGLKARMRTRVRSDSAGRITYSSRANAVTGRAK
jgi:ubiquinone/menaquinone biosynthesis C-methylase UbiE